MKNDESSAFRLTRIAKGDKSITARRRDGDGSARETVRGKSGSAPLNSVRRHTLKISVDVCSYIKIKEAGFPYKRAVDGGG